MRHAFSLALAAAALALAACADRPSDAPRVVDKPQTVTVDVPVAVSCVAKDFPPRPVFPDTPAALKAARDMAERDRLVKGAWPLRDARLKALEDQVDRCR